MKNGPSIPVKTMSGRIIGEVTDVDLGDGSLFVLINIEDPTLLRCFEDRTITDYLEIRVQERTKIT